MKVVQKVRYVLRSLASIGYNWVTYPLVLVYSTKVGSYHVRPTQGTGDTSLSKRGEAPIGEDTRLLSLIDFHAG